MSLTIPTPALVAANRSARLVQEARRPTFTSETGVSRPVRSATHRLDALYARITAMEVGFRDEDECCLECWAGREAYAEWNRVWEQIAQIERARRQNA